MGEEIEIWCPGTESNRHAPFGARDFKSRASASFATRAVHIFRILPKVSLIRCAHIMVLLMIRGFRGSHSVALFTILVW
jgi:hypothetical protein